MADEPVTTITMAEKPPREGSRLGLFAAHSITVSQSLDHLELQGGGRRTQRS